MRGRRMRRGIKVLLMVPVVVMVVALVGFLFMLLWNGLMPGLFGLRAIGYWQALGILILSRILFGGGFRGRSHGRGWRRRIIERWENMTPEEREMFRKGMRPLGCETPKS